MSNIPLISHRMFVAAVSQERRPATPVPREDPQWSDGYPNTIEVLDPPDWTSHASDGGFSSPACPADDL